ncbi:MAG: hypothetical protein DHS20C18_12010 [Saprospiraceae bacterium]|nr:MAG: hypothetical protein DHS20C18_12010 [Saprospiraceae bacterium]
MGGNPSSSITGVILMVFFLIALFYLARIVFQILYFLAPVMLIATLIIDYKVVWSYLQWMGRLLKNNPLLGVGAIVLNVLCFPLITAFLLGKALLKRKVKQVRNEVERNKEGEFVEFEEIVDEPPLILPEFEEKPRQTRRARNNDYEDLFDE